MILKLLSKRIKRSLGQFLFLLIPGVLTFTQGLESGKMVPNVKLIDVYDKEKNMPYLGSKTFILFYVDPDRQHIIDPLTKVIDSEDFSQTDFEVVSVIDCRDTWIPFFALRTGAKREQRLYPDSPILFDREHLLSSAWGFGECDNRWVVVIIGKDSRMKFIQNLKSEEECKSMVEIVLNILKATAK